MAWIPAFAGMTKVIAKITPLIRLPSQVDVFDYFIPPELEDKIKIGQMVSIPWRNRYVNGAVLSLRALTVAPPVGGGGLGVNSAKQSYDRDDGIVLSRPSVRRLADYGVAPRNDKKKFRARPIKKIIEPQPILTFQQLALIKKFSDYYFVTAGSVARLITPARPTRIGQTRTAIIRQSLSFQIAKSQLPLLEQAAKKFLPALGKQTPTYPPLTKGGIKGGLLEIHDISSFLWFVFYLLKGQAKTLLLLLPTLNLINIFSSALKKCQTQMAIIHSGLSLGAYWQTYQKILNGQARIILSTRQGVFLPIPTNSTIIMFDSGSADFKQYDQHPRYDARHVAHWTAKLTKSQLILASALPPPWERAGVRGTLHPATRHKTAIHLVDMKQKISSPEFSIVSDEAIEEIREAKTVGKKALIIALRVEAEQGVSVKKINNILTKIGKNVNVTVSTPHLLESGQLLPYRGQIACLILASIEPLLALPDYRAAERALYRLKHWQMWAQELAIPKIILQSYSPDNLAVRAFAYGEVERFVQTELENRKRFDYPPFAQLIKLTYQGKDVNEINRLAALLKARASDKLAVRGPYQAHKSDKKSILLKIPRRHTKQRHAELVSASGDADISFLRALSSDWAIDRDPENVL